MQTLREIGYLLFVGALCGIAALFIPNPAVKFTEHQGARFQDPKPGSAEPAHLLDKRVSPSVKLEVGRTLGQGRLSPATLAYWECFSRALVPSPGWIGFRSGCLLALGSGRDIFFHQSPSRSIEFVPLVPTAAGAKHPKALFTG